MEFLIDGLIEVGQILAVHLLAIVADERGEKFTVGRLVPLLAIVIESEILLLGFVLRPLDLFAPVTAPGTSRQLIVEREEGLSEQGANASQLHALLIELCHLVKVKFAFQITRGLLPLTYLGLKLLLLLDECDAVDTFVHADGVLPIVGGVGIL